MVGRCFGCVFDAPSLTLWLRPWGRGEMSRVICNSIHYNKVYNTKQYEKYGTIVVNIVSYNTYSTIRKMTLQYNRQYKSILYRINVQYGKILCTIQLYNKISIVWYCTLHSITIPNNIWLQYQTILDYNTKQYFVLSSFWNCLVLVTLLYVIWAAAIVRSAAAIASGASFHPILAQLTQSQSHL